VPAEAVVAVETVLLAAGDCPRGILRAFYERILGLKCVPTDTHDPDLNSDVRFKHCNRELLLSRERKDPGHVRLLVRNLGDAMIRLKDRGLSFDVLHGDSGLMRTVIVRDPAGNWIELQETRPL
jgi:catechol 2,3-dioxygenase-like lactoylglutathione lyase family enzyme